MGTARRPERQLNMLLQRARLNQRSPSGSGRPMSRQELADSVNAYLYQTSGRQSSIDAHYIGKLERGCQRRLKSGSGTVLVIALVVLV